MLDGRVLEASQVEYKPLPALAQAVVEGPRLLQFSVALQQQRLQVVAGVRFAKPPEHPRLVARFNRHHASAGIRFFKAGPPPPSPQQATEHFQNGVGPHVWSDETGPAKLLFCCDPFSVLDDL